MAYRRDLHQRRRRIWGMIAGTVGGGTGGDDGGGGGPDDPPPGTTPSFTRLLDQRTELSTDTNIATDTTATIPVGAFLAMSVGWVGNSLSSTFTIVDPGGNTWTLLDEHGTLIDGGGALRCRLYGCRVANGFSIGGGDQITLTHPAAWVRSIVVAEFADVPASFQDQSASDGDLSNTFTAGPITPSVTRSLGLGAVAIHTDSLAEDNPRPAADEDWTEAGHIWDAPGNVDGNPIGATTLQLETALYYRIDSSNPGAYSFEGDIVGEDIGAPATKEWAACVADVKGT